MITATAPTTTTPAPVCPITLPAVPGDLWKSNQLVAQVQGRSLASTCPWAASVGRLMDWAWERLVNRVDVWGAYGTDGQPFTGKARDSLGLAGGAEIRRHFLGTAGATIGVHAIGADGTCRWVAIDLDDHGGDLETAARNDAAARAWQAMLGERGISSLVENSNGAGGRHLWVLFSEPIPSKAAHKFARWVIRDADELGVAVEVFPKQPSRDGLQFGSWLRLPGRHHKRPWWSTFWNPAEQRWLAGLEAAEHMLVHQPVDPATLPWSEIETWAAQQVASAAVPPRDATSAGPVDRSSLPSLSERQRRAEAYVMAMPAAVSGQGGHNATFRACCAAVVDFDLTPEEAYPVIAEWNRGCLPPWSEAELWHKLRDASRQPGERGRKLRDQALGGDAGGVDDLSWATWGGDAAVPAAHALNPVASEAEERPYRDVAEYRAESARRMVASLAAPGVYLHPGPPGSGKSTAARPAMQQAGSAAIIVDTNKFAKEYASGLTQAGFDARAYPSLSVETCQRFADVEGVMGAGLVFQRIICPGCDFRDECGYLHGVANAKAAPYSVCAKARGVLSFPGVAEGKRFILIEEDPIGLLRPISEVTKMDGFEKVARVARRAKDDAKTRNFMDEAHYYQRMEAIALELANALMAAEATTPLLVASASTLPRNVDVDLWKAMNALKLYPPGDAVRIVRAAADDNLTEVVVRVDRVYARGRETQLHRSVLGVFSNMPPEGVPTWILDGSASREEIEAAAGQPVFLGAPEGRLREMHEIVQVARDVKIGTAPGVALGVLRGVMAAYPDCARFGVVCHRAHYHHIDGTSRSGPVLEPEFRSRITKLEYFHGGQTRGSNSWLGVCDRLVVLGTARVTESVIRTRLLRTGRAEAAARDGKWGPQTWHGETIGGQPVTVQTPGYNDADWAAAYRSTVVAEMVQAIHRGRALCENGIPVVVVSTENLGLKILPEKIQAVSDSEIEVLRTIVAILEEAELSAQNSTGSGRPDYRHCSLQYIIGNGAVSSSALANRLSLKERRIRYLLNNLESRNLVERVGERGGWRLTEAGLSLVSPPTPSTSKPTP